MRGYQQIYNLVQSGQKTISGLTISPREAYELAEQGKPISIQSNDPNYFDGVQNPSFDLPAFKERGADLNTIWKAQQVARESITVSMANDIEYNESLEKQKKEREKRISKLFKKEKEDI